MQLLRKLRECSVWRKVDEVSRRASLKGSIEGNVNGFVPIQKFRGWGRKVGMKF